MAKGKSTYYEEKDLKAREQLDELKHRLPQYMHDYVIQLAISHQIRTCIAYTRELLTFLAYIQEMNPNYANKSLSEIPHEAISQITSRDINEYIVYLTSHQGKNRHKNGNAALQRSMSALRSYFAYEENEETITKNPMPKAAKPQRVMEQPIERLSTEQAKELLVGVESVQTKSERSEMFRKRTRLRDRAIVMLLLNTGIRISECVGLDVTDINDNDQSFVVVRKGGNKERLYLNDEAYAAIIDYIEEERPAYAPKGETALFISNRKQRMSVGSIQAMLKTYGESVLDLDDNLHPHTLRRTYGTLLYEATTDIALVSTTLGHKSLDTTRKHYADVSEKQKQRTRAINLYEE